MEVAMTTPALTTEYFIAKKGQKRKKAANVGEKVFDAIEIATKALRLCYPLPEVKAVHCYYNNEKIEPFIAPQHGEEFATNHDGDGEVKDFIVIDVYFFLGFNAYEPVSEKDAFVVEVVFPKQFVRKRWNIARVR